MTLDVQNDLDVVTRANETPFHDGTLIGWREMLVLVLNLPQFTWSIQINAGSVGLAQQLGTRTTLEGDVVCSSSGHLACSCAVVSGAQSRILEACYSRTSPSLNINIKHSQFRYQHLGWVKSITRHDAQTLSPPVCVNESWLLRATRMLENVSCFFFCSR